MLKGYDATVPNALGRLVSNLLQLEFALRVSLQLDEPQERQLPLDAFRCIVPGNILPLNRLTAWDNLRKLVADFNVGQRAQGLKPINPNIVKLWDTLTHGRITNDNLESEFSLVRFAKPAGDHVTVELVQTVALPWLETQISHTSEATRTVWARIDEQRRARR